MQLKDLQAVIYSYTMDASPEKVLEKHIAIEAAARNLEDNMQVYMQVILLKCKISFMQILTVGYYNK